MLERSPDIYAGQAPDEEQKALLDNKMSEIDKKLVRIKSIILREKQEYEEEIKAMKKNVDFFDDSLEILNGIKGN